MDTCLKYFPTNSRGSCSAITAAAAASNPNSPANIKENLLKWCQLKTQGYPVNLTLKEIINLC